MGRTGTLTVGFRVRLVGLLVVLLACFMTLSASPQAWADGVDGEVPDLELAAAGNDNPHEMVSNDGEALLLVGNEMGLARAGRGVQAAESFAGDDSAAETMAASAEGQTPTDEKSLEEEAAFFQPEGDGTVLSRESVIGADGRTRVNPTTSYPSRAIVHLAVTWPNGTGGGCSGWLIGPRTVATAGHCVFNGGKGGWAKSITVTPGRNGATKPYGSTTARRLFSVTGWTSSGSANYDYGAIQLNSPIGNTVGWFGFRYHSANSGFNNLNVTVSGYPGDKPFGTMWRMSGGIQRVWERRFFYGLDTAPGQSGAPVYHNYSASCSPCGVAIHAYGVGGDPFGKYNSGTRITKAAFDNLLYWKNYP